MPVTGVPPWVPLLVGVLTLVGALGAQVVAGLIAGRNEKRRWIREQSEACASHWRYKRYDIYSEFLADATLCLRIISRAALDKLDSEKLRADIDSIFPGLNMRVIELIAPADVYKLSGLINKTIAELCRIYARSGSELAELQEVMDLLDAQLSEIHDLFRRDLGVAPERRARVLPSLNGVKSALPPEATQR